jgi:hypothetical protein
MMQPSGGMSFQSGINAGGQAVNGGVLSGLLAGTGSLNGGSATGNQMAAQVGRQATFANRAMAGNAAQQANAGHQMESQAKRSESLVNQADSHARRHQDYAQRRADSIGLAAQIQMNNIGYAAGLASLRRR